MNRNNPFLGGARASSPFVPVVNLLGGDSYEDLSRIPMGRPTPEPVARETSTIVTDTAERESDNVRWELDQLKQTMRGYLDRSARIEAENHELLQSKTRAEAEVRRLQAELDSRSRPTARLSDHDEVSRAARTDNFEDTVRQLESRMTGLEYRRVEKPVIRSSEIKEVGLEDLSTISSAHRLEDLFYQVEACDERDERRIRIALNKLELKARTVVQDKMKERPITNWREFKELCHEAFDIKVDPIEVIQDINTRFNYHIDKDPRLFVNELRAMLSSVAVENMPDQNLTIKRKLYDGLPRSLKGDLQVYMDDPKTTDGHFLKHVEGHRRIYLQINKGAHNVRELAEENRAPSYGIDEIASKIDTMMEKLEETESSIRATATDTRPKHRPRGCGYCNWKEVHWWTDCPKRPPPQSCFDCLQLGHKKGERACPKQQ